MKQSRLRALTATDLAFQVVVDGEQDNESQQNAEEKSNRRRVPSALQFLFASREERLLRGLHLRETPPDPIAKFNPLAIIPKGITRVFMNPEGKMCNRKRRMNSTASTVIDLA
jgi:hypothetical protein